MNREHLALFGGKPVRSDYLPYGKQWIEDDDIKAVTQVLESDWLTTGPAIPLFEKAIAEKVGASYAVAFSNGTAALHGACFAAGIKEGDEVITTPLTFAASANCVLYAGGTPVFADVCEETYNISPPVVKALISEKTKAIIAVDFTGQPADYTELRQMAKAHDLVLIGDAAHALGATYKGESIGSLCDMTMFSFHPVKHITSGEGGMITTNRKDLYEKLVQFRTHGITREPKTSAKPYYYEMQELGYNYRMTDLQAALGTSQVTKLPRFVTKRQEIAAVYTKAFEQLEGVTPPLQREDRESSWHLYILKLDLERLAADRDEIFRALLAENIGVNVHYIPVHLHPYYQSLGYKKGFCPVAESLYESIITLPLFPKMTSHDVKDVIQAVQKVIRHYLK